MCAARSWEDAIGDEPVGGPVRRLLRVLVRPLAAVEPVAGGRGASVRVPHAEARRRHQDGQYAPPDWWPSPPPALASCSRSCSASLCLPCRHADRDARERPSHLPQSEEHVPPVQQRRCALHLQYSIPLHTLPASATRSLYSASKLIVSRSLTKAHTLYNKRDAQVSGAQLT